jgi:hypothetical protein
MVAAGPPAATRSRRRRAISGQTATSARVPVRGLPRPLAATHAQHYMARARRLKSLVEGLLNRHARTDETPDAIRKAVGDLLAFKRNLNEL